MNNCAMIAFESLDEQKRSTETVDFTIDDLTSIYDSKPWPFGDG